MDSDCDNNPDFCNFNRVYMAYCDGNSFSGNRDQPVMQVRSVLCNAASSIGGAVIPACTAPFNTLI